MTTRRGLLTGFASFLAAPAIVRASSLMPISVPPEPRWVSSVWVNGVWHSAPVDNTFDIGAAGAARPRNIFAEAWEEILDTDLCGRAEWEAQQSQWRKAFAS